MALIMEGSPLIDKYRAKILSGERYSDTSCIAYTTKFTGGAENLSNESKDEELAESMGGCSYRNGESNYDIPDTTVNSSDDDLIVNQLAENTQGSVCKIKESEIYSDIKSKASEYGVSEKQLLYGVGILILLLLIS